jgi:hypothetical protein
MSSSPLVSSILDISCSSELLLQIRTKARIRTDTSEISNLREKQRHSTAVRNLDIIDGYRKAQVSLTTSLYTAAARKPTSPLLFQFLPRPTANTLPLLDRLNRQDLSLFHLSLVYVLLFIFTSIFAPLSSS